MTVICGSSEACPGKYAEETLIRQSLANVYQSTYEMILYIR